MCGILGIVHGTKQPIDRAVLKRMTAFLEHRGPDGEGYFIDEQCGFGHRRLAIIDLSNAANQPMGNQEGTLQLIFNGEIYNYRELRKELESKGRRFVTESDTEVILQGYAHWGKSIVEHLRGMFAFAIWDTRDPKKPLLFAARDRFGKKPFWYTLLGDTLVFASTLNAVLAYPGTSRNVDPISIWHFLSYGYIPSPRTIFKNIYKLPPAHTLIFTKEKIQTAIQTARYWNLSYIQKTQKNEHHLVAEIREKLREAVKLRMRSDVPLGAFLSGGIDSSSVVAFMAEHAKAESLSSIKTYSIGFPEQQYDERKYAKFVAEQFDTDHHEFVVDMQTAKILPALIWNYGEPYGDSSALPSYYLAQQTRKHVVVALNGDGGDELFAGYSRYAIAAIAQRYRRIPQILQNSFASLLRCIPEWIPPQLLISRAKRFFDIAHLHPEQAYAQLMQVLNHQTKKNICQTAFSKRKPNSDAIIKDAFHIAKTKQQAIEPVNLMLAVDAQRYLPDDLLVKMDVASMAHALESRSPYLDHHVAEFVSGIAPSYKLQGTTTKYILKKALSPILPKEILHRPKQGFGIPIHAWFRGELGEIAETVLLSDTAMHRNYFKPEKLASFISQHKQGKKNNGYGLWNLLWLELWHRMYVDAELQPTTNFPTLIL